MKVTEEMMRAFREAVRQGGDSVDDIREAGIQAVLDLITVDPGHQVYYRSLTQDGTVWGESSASSDFPHTSPKSGPLTYQKIEIDTMSSGWQEWTP